MQTCAVLYLLGVAFEFSGIVLLGFPDLLPWGLRLSAWLARMYAGLTADGREKAVAKLTEGGFGG